MKFIVDECTGSNVANFLFQKGFEVISIFDQFRGVTDDFILEKCHTESYVLVTSDKDFGEMIFRQNRNHSGIILIRCEPNNFITRIEILIKLFENYSHEIENNFIVVTNTKVRVIK